MNAKRTAKHLRSAAALTLSAMLLAAPTGTVSASSFTAPFTHYADGQPLGAVLSSFARSQGLRAEVESDVEGTVSGRFSRVSPRDFMGAMREAYGVGCYVLGDTAHFYSQRSVRKEFITIPNGTNDGLLTALEHSGFVADELPIKTSPEGGMLIVEGPESYITQVQAAAAAYQASLAEKVEMRVFPLKFAWADDITLENMDRQVTVPGIASILRGMVLGQSVGGETVSAGRGANVPTVPSLTGEGLSRQSVYREKKAAQVSAAAEPASPAAGNVSIMADPRVNAVLVSDAAYRMPYYEKVIKELDKPVELVEIHAAIVDIDTNASRDLGVNLSGRGGSGNWQGGGTAGAGNSDGFDSAGNPIITTSSGSAGGILSTIYTHGSDYFMARITALEEENAARMLGRPSVLTVDNVQAVLENTTTYYIPLRGIEAVDLYKVESGTVLRVTPHIIHGEDGKTSIKLAVSVQDDQSDAGSGYQNIGGETSDAITVSPIKQTRINTQAMVGEGDSLLIGGYYYEQKTEGTSGVPFLKDIPLLGALFRSSSQSGRQMERLILITPRIVTAEVDNVPTRVRVNDFKKGATDNDYELPQTSGDAPLSLEIRMLSGTGEDSQAIRADEGMRVLPVTTISHSSGERPAHELDGSEVLTLKETP